MLATVVQKIPVGVQILGAVIAIFLAGIGTKAALDEYIKAPEDLASMSEKITILESKIDELTTRFEVYSQQSRRMDFIEDTICSPTSIEGAGPDRDRRCYAMTQSRMGNTIPQAIPQNRRNP